MTVGFDSLLVFLLLLTSLSCTYISKNKEAVNKISSTDSLGAFANDSIKDFGYLDTTGHYLKQSFKIDTKKIHPKEVVDFAKTLIGTGYKYGSTDPRAGFDCSGFITYVFGHFGIKVPRSSIDFTNAGKAVDLKKCRYGDLILFTGTDSTKQYIGHIGLIIRNEQGIVEFIHSSSGRAYGVTITLFNAYYNTRYLKTIRIFPESTW